MTDVKVDLKSAFAGLDALGGTVAKSLLRSMLVAGGKVYRDEAQLLAPKKSGLLASSIYLAHKDGKSKGDLEVYSVTWNSKKAPHGHLVEFGHWDKAQLHYTPAHPFLRPAYEGASVRAQTAMFDRAKVRLPELLAEVKK